MYASGQLECYVDTVLNTSMPMNVVSMLPWQPRSIWTKAGFGELQCRYLAHRMEQLAGNQTVQCSLAAGDMVLCGIVRLWGGSMPPGASCLVAPCAAGNTAHTCSCSGSIVCIESRSKRISL